MCSEGFLADSSTSTLELALPAMDEGSVVCLVVVHVGVLVTLVTHTYIDI
jgi:hypothetical protein